ncbi:P-loop containing nucleoside triphosphate hydrolase protein [Staphylotrichum tortipilum]|uniref:ATP-dependent RNA helicase n=1 Tax=Staphylotrichum tortipilum TaxID=2831512 RepID=A0AAN6MU13_9PEZI|nr:P-loop containing nucleoside triphosphate hydrolase protein [Staphylotrichum longicolle]
MMKTSLLRQAAARRAVASATALPARLAFRSSSGLLSLSRPSQSAASLVCRPLSSSLPRFYSSESAAAESTEGAANGLITQFKDMIQLGVHERIVSSITDHMGYQDMTEVQSMTINAALAGKDVVAQAKTGTGKTLAFLVPIVQRIIAEDPQLALPRRVRARADDIRALILSPTRELAEQIGEEARKLCRGTGVIVQTAVGGTQKGMMLRQARMQGCHLMVATPGRMYDLLEDQTSGIDAPRLNALVLDEADRMLDVGFKMELENILRYLPERAEIPRQTLLYSATLPKNVVGLARQFINPANFEFVQTVSSDEVPTHERVPQFIVPCRGFENLAPTVLELMRRDIKKGMDGEAPPFKAIVFLPTTASVMTYSYMFQRLRRQDRTLPQIMSIHSKLTQAMRADNANNFKNARSAILFASDVAARGMDFPNVSHVIQVHLPQDRDLYIHRIGRTGRAGKEGQAYLMVADVEIPGARSRLPGLPIQRCTDFESASLDVSKEQVLPEIFQTVQDAAKMAPYEVLSDMYSAFLGNAIRDVHRQDIVHEINNMARYNWGMDEPPTVSPKLHSGKLTGLRFNDHVGGGGRGGFGGGRGFGGGDRGYGGRGFGGRDRQPQDGFERMERSGREQNRSDRRARSSF